MSTWICGSGKRQDTRYMMPRSRSPGAQRCHSFVNFTGFASAASKTTCPDCQLEFPALSSWSREDGHGDPILTSIGNTHPSDLTRESISWPSRVCQKCTWTSRARWRNAFRISEKICVSKSAPPSARVLLHQHYANH